MAVYSRIATLKIPIFTTVKDLELTPDDLGPTLMDAAEIDWGKEEIENEEELLPFTYVLRSPK